jgi:hypothetical protein
MTRASEDYVNVSTSLFQYPFSCLLAYQQFMGPLEQYLVY